MPPGPLPPNFRLLVAEERRLRSMPIEDLARVVDQHICEHKRIKTQYSDSTGRLRAEKRILLARLKSECGGDDLVVDGVIHRVQPDGNGFARIDL